MRITRAVLPAVLFIIATGILYAAAGPQLLSSVLEGPFTPTLTENDVLALNNIFTDKPFLGGQQTSTISKWVNENTFLFFQFQENSTALRYAGMGMKGVFCEQPKDIAFTAFHKWSVASFEEGRGGQPGDEGYWLLRTAADNFYDEGRQMRPGIDYSFEKTPAPQCSNVPDVQFIVPSKKVSRQDVAAINSLFTDNPFDHVQPRIMKSVNDHVFVFLQFDTGGDVQIAYAGIAVKGKFCSNSRPSLDFSHFQRLSADSYNEGFGGKAGDEGYWLMFMPTDNFDDGARPVFRGIDRMYEKTEAPDCLL